MDGDGDVVRTLLESRSQPAGRLEASWDGRDDDGNVVPEGAYRPRVHLARQRRTIVLPNPIEVDVTAPVAELVSVDPTVFSPDGDGRSDKVTVRYRMSEPANALLLVDGEQRVRTRFAPVEGKLDWFGIVDGRPLRRGMHALQVVGVDRAGNRSQPTGETRVRIRSIDLARALVRVPPRVRFGIGVDTDAASYRWRFAGGTGTASGPLLVLRAPGPAGPVHALRRGERARRPRHGARPCTLSWRRSAGSWAPPGSRSSSSRRRAASGWSASSAGPPGARPSRPRWRRAGAAS